MPDRRGDGVPPLRLPQRPEQRLVPAARRADVDEHEWADGLLRHATSVLRPGPTGQGPLVVPLPDQPGDDARGELGQEALRLGAAARHVGLDLGQRVRGGDPAAAGAAGSRVTTPASARHGTPAARAQAATSAGALPDSICSSRSLGDDEGGAVDHPRQPDEVAHETGPGTTRAPIAIAPAAVPPAPPEPGTAATSAPRSRDRTAA